MKIGIFGGSFDPVHIEHQNLCKAALESLKLDKLFVVPAATPPHKQGKAISASEDRLALCRAAFEGEEKIEVSRYEIEQQGTSYTYLTMEHFKALYPQDELYFLVGTDMLRNFPFWKHPERILACATLAVCARAENKGWDEVEQAEFFKRFQTHFAVIDYQGKAVSSTRVRVLAAAGEDISPLVGERVAKEVERLGLYQIDGVKQALSLQKPTRRQHSIRVAFFAAEHAAKCGVEERKAIAAALMHDCAKNLDENSPLLQGFTPPQRVPAPVLHQYAGAYVAKNTLGVMDEDVLNAICYHTSGRENMSALEKLIFLADMLEEGRAYKEVDELRQAFFTRGLDEGLTLALLRSLEFLKEKGQSVYPLTQKAYDFMNNQRR